MLKTRWVRYDKGMVTTSTTSTKKTIIITGASAGIGKAAATELAKDNTVIIVGRSESTKDVASAIGADYYRVDYTDLSSVRALAKELLSHYPTIDLLINNAGGVMNGIVQTNDGFEKTIQVNYLAPFLLTELLLERLISSKGAIINTSSSAQFFSHLKTDDIQTAKAPFVAYGNGKLLDLIHAKELSRRYKDQGIDAVSFHPGVVATNFGVNNDGSFSWLKVPLIRRLLKTPEQGADTMVWLARNRNLWQSGAYYSKRKLAHTNAMAKNTQAHIKIWDLTLSLLGLDEKAR